MNIKTPQSVLNEISQYTIPLNEILKRYRGVFQVHHCASPNAEDKELFFVSCDLNKLEVALQEENNIKRNVD